LGILVPIHPFAIPPAERIVSTFDSQRSALGSRLSEIAKSRKTAVRRASAAPSIREVRRICGRVYRFRLGINPDARIAFVIAINIDIDNGSGQFSVACKR
jgi:hypothetical protein